MRVVEVGNGADEYVWDRLQTALFMSELRCTVKTCSAEGPSLLDHSATRRFSAWRLRWAGGEFA